MDDKRKKEIQEYAERKASEPLFGRGSPRDDGAEYRQAMQENAPYLSLGIQMALTIAAFAGLGWWLDKENGTSMWIGICSGFGAVAGLGYFLLVVLRMEKKKEAKRK
ncbi:MAG: AtpZ/AtpI family protein [Bacteroidota bacterium]|nr:AtpZ/AtpI family protein [Bacteroidota bacterium]MDP4229400.1 AtpZ/AtpI family protein [Bacteroidota bacterium]MDP4237351.1 AtpZ/AtpI family protein [Bacteroidota bacterium]